MTPEHHDRVVQALRNASVLVAAHVDGAEHAFAARQLQLSIALLLNELSANIRASKSERDFSSPKPPRSDAPQEMRNVRRTKQMADA